MYTIVMTDYKGLITTSKTTLYQRENFVDEIQFLIPTTYNETDLSDFTVILKYVDPANVAHSEILTKDDDLYKEKLRYTLPVDTDLTKFSGDITVSLTLSKTDIYEKKQYVLHSGETVISISPRKDLYAFVTDESLEYVDQLFGQLDARMEAIEKMTEIYDAEKADNITYEDSMLQLTSNGNKIGDAIQIISDDSEDSGTANTDTEFEIVEF